jgi:cytochrome d ubiquinol oxidase subunit II
MNLALILTSIGDLSEPNLTSILAAGLIIVALIAYAVLGGADYGGGVWDLFARGSRAKEQRTLIAQAMGPVWEANHIWLIFAVVVLFTCFPAAFAVVGEALPIPISAALIGISLRGAAFAFRASYWAPSAFRDRMGTIFGVASLITPFGMGAALAALASGDITLNSSGIVDSSVWVGWLTPFAIGVGALALSLVAYLAAAFLCLEAEGELREDFRRRALGAAVAVGVTASLTLPLAADAVPSLWVSLTQGVARPFLLIAPAFGLASLASLYLRQHRLAAAAAVGQTAAILFGWGVASYPYLIFPTVTLAGAAAAPQVQLAILVGAAAGLLVLVPSLWLLFRLFKGKMPGMVVAPKVARTRR